MLNKTLNRYWNLKLLGFPKFLFSVISVIYLRAYEKISSVFWKKNFKKCANNVFIQKGCQIRYPGQITLSNNVSIGRNCQISSEFNDAYLIIGSFTHIDKKCVIDFSGNLIIGKNVTISESVMIETHNHGLLPRSKPKRNSLLIEDNVWIGARAIILPNVKKIGKNAIIGAGSIVTKEVNANVVVAGNPAKVLKQIM